MKEVSPASFLERSGFQGDPFASTNSETEESLADYFVPPPYFEGVRGSADSPATAIIFAPRGSGKTAQRRMIEISAAETDEIVCVTYVDFADLMNGNSNLADHHRAICKLLTLAALAHLDHNSDLADALGEHEKRVIKTSARLLLEELTADQFGSALSAVKSAGDRAREFWRKYGGVVSTALTAIMRKGGIEDVSLSSDTIAAPGQAPVSLRYLYSELITVLNVMGFKAVYILVDKVDETPETGNDPKRAFELLQELMLDLPTLENRKVAFKFFLWDQIELHFREAGGRDDRLQVSQLKWTFAELSQMLSRRLESFSSGAIQNFNELVDPAAGIDAHALLARLNPDSPRDMIRMAGRVISEHTRQPGSADLVSRDTIFSGVHQFCEARSKELFSKYLTDLQKLPEQSFTMSKLSSDVFKISVPAVRNKVMAWSNVGAVRKIGERGQGAKPIHTYSISDPRLALTVFPRAALLEVLQRNMFICPGCDYLIIASVDSFPCPDCGMGSVAESRNLWESCTSGRETH